MTQHTVTAIVLAAGHGTRMKSNLPKVMHAIGGRPMINHLVATLEGIGVDSICAVIGNDMADVADAVSPHSTAKQFPALGTGHAVLSARETLGELGGDVMTLFGADPLISPETLQRMIDRRRAADNPAVVALGFRPEEAGLYGRLIAGDGDTLDAIVEARECTPEQLNVPLCNSGVFVIDGSILWSLLERVTDDNAKGEFYLTDIVAIARADGRVCALVEGDADELIGVDSRADLAVAEALLQSNLRKQAMDNGATLIDPDSVVFNFDTTLGRDVIVEPNVVFGPGVDIHDNVRIRAFSHLEGCIVSSGAIVGPYARLRPGANIGEDVHIGNFVEIKNATMGPGAKANHLSYIGDSTVGAKTNIGAGTITANYDGFNKHRTDIGEGVSIGSNVVLVAPVSVGDGANVGAGSTITTNVDADALAVTRAERRSIAGWAAKFRARYKKDK
jgi:bifunctional UDP-N-acetylglucosamine pyrophosphorylase / glucosamine-1-phosphate N-acetyltransferase